MKAGTFARVCGWLTAVAAMVGLSACAVLQHPTFGKLPEGSVTGKNMRDNNYMGPGAPPGPRYHHYVFEFYALNAKLDLPETASRPELLAAMKGKVIAKAAYVGRFKGTAPAGGPPPAR